jgi:hypothetical protein
MVDVVPAGAVPLSPEPFDEDVLPPSLKVAGAALDALYSVGPWKQGFAAVSDVWVMRLDASMENSRWLKVLCAVESKSSV